MIKKLEQGISDQLLDFINEVKNKPFHINTLDRGGESVNGLIELGDSRYLKLIYLGHSDYVSIEGMGKGKYEPILFYEVVFLDEGEKIEDISRDELDDVSFVFPIYAIEEFVLRTKDSLEVSEETTITLKETLNNMTNLVLFPDIDYVFLEEIDFEENEHKKVWLSKELVNLLKGCFKILADFNFYLNELPGHN